jgi:ribosomal protein S27AE
MFSPYLSGTYLLSNAIAERTAAEAGNRADTATRTVRELEARIDRLTLVNLAIWSLLREKTGLTEENLLERVREIDSQDGVVDGKLPRQVRKCEQCGRVMSARHSTCFYCGHAELVNTAFDSI